jgi:hypothetical protein
MRHVVDHRRAGEDPMENRLTVRHTVWDRFGLSRGRHGSQRRRVGPGSRPCDAGAVESAGQPDVAVVVPTYQRPEGAARLVSALERQTLRGERWELVIVDDDGLLEAAWLAQGLAVLEASPCHQASVHAATLVGKLVAGVREGTLLL